MRRVKCELCGEEFDCMGNRGCWCARIRVSETRRKQIALLAGDCVCRACLTKGANEAGLHEPTKDSGGLSQF